MSESSRREQHHFRQPRVRGLWRPGRVCSTSDRRRRRCSIQRWVIPSTDMSTAVVQRCWAPRRQNSINPWPRQAEAYWHHGSWQCRPTRYVCDIGGTSSSNQLAAALRWCHTVAPQSWAIGRNSNIICLFLWIRIRLAQVLAALLCRGYELGGAVLSDTKPIVEIIKIPRNIFLCKIKETRYYDLLW